MNSLILINEDEDVSNYVDSEGKYLYKYYNSKDCLGLSHRMINEISLHIYLGKIPYIIPLLSFNEDTLIFPYHTTSLSKSSNMSYSHSEQIELAKGLIELVYNLNIRDILICNLTPENLFYHNSHWVISDISKCLYNPGRGSITGDLYPNKVKPFEGFYSSRYSFGSDVWALGMCLFQCIVGDYTCQNINDVRDFVKYKKGILYKSKHLWHKDLYGLVSRMLNLNHKKRMTIHDLFSHSLFNHIPISFVIKEIPYPGIENIDLQMRKTCVNWLYHKSMSDVGDEWGYILSVAISYLDTLLSKYSYPNTYSDLVVTACYYLASKVCDYIIDPKSLLIGDFNLESLLIQEGIVWKGLGHETNITTLWHTLEKAGIENIRKKSLWITSFYCSSMIFKYSSVELMRIVLVNKNINRFLKSPDLEGITWYGTTNCTDR